MRLQLKPSLGITKLDRVSALQVQSLYRSKLESGLSPITYSHVLPNMQEKAVEAMEEILDGKD